MRTPPGAPGPVHARVPAARSPAVAPCAPQDPRSRPCQRLSLEYPLPCSWFPPRRPRSSSGAWRLRPAARVPALPSQISHSVRTCSAPLPLRAAAQKPRLSNFACKRYRDVDKGFYTVKITSSSRGRVLCGPHCWGEKATATRC